MRIGKRRKRGERFRQGILWMPERSGQNSCIKQPMCDEGHQGRGGLRESSGPLPHPHPEGSLCREFLGKVLGSHSSQLRSRMTGYLPYLWASRSFSAYSIRPLGFRQWALQFGLSHEWTNTFLLLVQPSSSGGQRRPHLGPRLLWPGSPELGDQRLNSRPWKKVAFCSRLQLRSIPMK